MPITSVTSDHDFVVGGRAHYTMGGPDGAQSSGWWRFVAIERPRLIEIEDGFAAADGTPDTTMPSMRMTFTSEATANGSRFIGPGQEKQPRDRDL